MDRALLTVLVEHSEGLSHAAMAAYFVLSPATDSV